MKKKILCTLASFVVGMTFVSCGSAAQSEAPSQSSKEIKTVLAGEKPQLTTDPGLFWELKTGMTLDEVIQKFGTPCVKSGDDCYTWCFDSDKTFNKYNEISQKTNSDDDTWFIYGLTISLKENIMSSFNYGITFYDADTALSAFEEFTQKCIGNEEYYEDVSGQMKSRTVLHSEKFNGNTISVNLMAMDDFYDVSIFVNDLSE